MATEVKVPALGESVTEATVAKWYKKSVKLLQPMNRLSNLKPTR